MNLFRRTLISLSTVALVAAGLVVGAAPASAAHVTCGQTILVSTTLDSNVGPCNAGLTIGADNITLDLGGFTLSGFPGVGEDAGILLDGRTGVTVRNGTVTQFDTGVAVLAGSANTVTGMTLINNRSSTSSDFGEGVLLFNSTGNTVSNSMIRNNGPFAGVSLLIASNNLVAANQITGNNQSPTNTSGIRLENIGRTASNANTVRDNLVQGSGLDGIQLFAGASNNTIARNSVLQNNRDGITAFAGSNNNVIEDNQARSNGFGPIAGHGIFIRGAAGAFAAPSGNIIRRNSASGNATFDLRDGTPNCGTNIWSANQGTTGTPPCVFNP
jgi:parallel beta-helix repeat protein